MSQPDFAPDPCPVDTQSHATGSNGAESPDSIHTFPATAAFSQDASAHPDQLTRIYNLEQALDQALLLLRDLQQRVQEQNFLEAQLAKTEDYASVQQQAIASLKQQLSHQERVLHCRDQLICALLLFSYPWQIPPSDPVELDTPVQLALPLDQHPPDCNPPETAQLQLQTARQQVQQLAIQVTELEVQVQESVAQLEERQVLQLTLRQTKTRVAEQRTAIASLEKELAIAQIKVEELETQLSKQHRLQSRLQQSGQELEAECERHRNRIAALEQEVMEMQEQILQQARQASEYEAAVQHWKDRYLANQRQILQLGELLAQVLPPTLPNGEQEVALNPALHDLLLALEQMVAAETAASDSLSSPPHRFTTLDVPDFLIRRRNWTR